MRTQRVVALTVSLVVVGAFAARVWTLYRERSAVAPVALRPRLTGAGPAAPEKAEESISLVWSYRSPAGETAQVLSVAPDGRIWYAQTDWSASPEGTTSLWVVGSPSRASGYAPLPEGTECLTGSVSPDGAHLAYATQRSTERGNEPVGVYLMSSKGDDNRRVATCSYAGQAGAWVYRLSWSPDGKRLAIPVTEGGRSRIVLLTLSTRQMRYLSAPEWADVTNPDWSPDGKAIAYSCEDTRWKAKLGVATSWTAFDWWPEAEDREVQKHLRPAAIWVTDLESGKSRAVTPTPPEDVVDLLPRWSPDGKKIAYCRWEWRHDLGVDMHYWWLDLRVAAADGTGDRAVKYRSEHASELVPAAAAEAQFEWLRDSRALIVMASTVSGEGRGCGLAAVNVEDGTVSGLTPDMGGWRQLAIEHDSINISGSMLVESFALSPDRSYAIAEAEVGSRRALWQVPVPSASPSAP